MLDSIIIGQYVPGKSFVHRLDPRVKMCVIFLFVIIIFLANSFWSYAVLTIFAALSVAVTRIPVKFILKGLLPIWFLIIFTFLLHLVITKDGSVLIDIFGWKIYTGGVIKGFAISMRFFLLIVITSLLTLTTTPIEVTDAIEYLLHPLKKVKFPVHELALMMSISLRFIPTLLQETEKITQAQSSRGLDFKTGKIKERLKAVIPLLVPLFISAFKRAEELAMAMEARGYRGGEGRTKLRALTMGYRDLIAIFVFIIATTGLFMLRYY